MLAPLGKSRLLLTDPSALPNSDFTLPFGATMFDALYFMATCLLATAAGLGAAYLYLKHY